MKIWFQKWWGNRCFQILSYRKAWMENGIGMVWGFRTNGAKKSRPTDTCLDVTLNLGYLVINYTNFNFQDSLFV